MAEPKLKPDSEAWPEDGQPAFAANPVRTRDQRWIRVIWPVAVIAACAELGTAILNNSTLPIFFTKGLGLDPFITGLIMIPFFVSEALFKSPLGVLADRIGRKPLMAAGASVTIFTPLLLMLLHYHPALKYAVVVLMGFGLMRLFDGLGGAALWPALFAYVGDHVDENKRGAAMALLNVVYMVGLALGFWIGGQADDIFGPVFAGTATLKSQVHELGQRIGNGLHHRHIHPPTVLEITLHQPGHYYPSFFLSSALFGLATIMCLVGLRGRTKFGGDAHSDRETISWGAFVESVRLVPQYIGLAFVTFLGIGNIAPIVKLFALDEFHLTEQQVGLLTLEMAMIVAAVAYPLGHLADRWGKVRSVRLGFCLCAAGLWGIPLLLHNHAVRETGFVLSAAIIGMGFVIAFPAWNALLTTLTEENRRGSVIGAVTTGQGLGVLLGYISGGALYRHRHFVLFGHAVTVGGHATPFLLAAVLVSIGAAAALFAIREKPSASAG